VTHAKLRPLFSAEEIAARVDAVAARVRRDYAEKDPVLVSILKGSALFLSDLVRRLDFPLTYEFLSVTRRESGSGEALEIDFLTQRTFRDAHVIVLKDVVNTGIIESYLMDQWKSDNPRSVRFACIADRPEERKSSVFVDYSLFSSPNGVLVGYGMEHAGRWGHLPHIAVLDEAGVQ
jgi:hypoxanthine phosphoribosyltransferase